MRFLSNPAVGRDLGRSERFVAADRHALHPAGEAAVVGYGVYAGCSGCPIGRWIRAASETDIESAGSPPERYKRSRSAFGLGRIHVIDALGEVDVDVQTAAAGVRDVVRTIGWCASG